MVTSTENETNEDMEQKITAQIEVFNFLYSNFETFHHSCFSIFQYYFDDLNLKQDKFMKYHMRKDEGCKFIFIYV